MEPLILIKWVEAGLWLVSIEGTYCNWTESFERASHWPESILKAGLMQLENKPGRTLIADQTIANPGTRSSTTFRAGDIMPWVGRSMDRKRALRLQAETAVTPLTTVHYAGALRWKTARGRLVTILPGWAACCSGDRAKRVRASGQHTHDRGKVTCHSCLANMAKAAALDAVTEPETVRVNACQTDLRTPEDAAALAAVVDAVAARMGDEPT